MNAIIEPQNLLERTKSITLGIITITPAGYKA